MSWLGKLQQLENPDSTCWSTDPELILDRGEGSRLYDSEGRAYLDMCAGFGALPLGHNHHTIKNVLQQQLDSSSILHGLGDLYPSRDKIEFLETLVQTLPPHLYKASLALTGSQAVEIAMKSAMLATQKTGFICFEEAYHGLDFGSCAVTFRNDFRTPFRSWLNEEKVSFAPWGTESIKTFAKDLPGGCAGILVEPIQGRGGIRLPPDGWLRFLREQADALGAVLIFDEVFTGFGRSGRVTFADDIHADLVCFGKAIGGGMPLSAVVGSENVFDAWPENQGEAIHTGTFFGHPLSCRVGKTTIEYIAEHDLVSRAVSFGNSLRRKLREQLPEHIQIRGAGQMTAIDFDVPFKGVEAMNQLREKGVVAIPSGIDGRILSLSPALTITEDELDEFVDVFSRLSVCRDSSLHSE